jgi:hypothetical protein
MHINELNFSETTGLTRLSLEGTGAHLLTRLNQPTLGQLSRLDR